MKAKVFVSCGQSRRKEIDFADKLKSWLSSKGFNPYVAKQSQSIQDVDSKIIDNLQKSDFYIFIDFRREAIKSKKHKTIYRGSLFTNQELAIAYYLKFERVIFFQQSKVVLEGLLKYMLSNGTIFSNYNDLFEKIREKIEEKLSNKDWDISYTRHLICENLRWSSETNHTDHVGNNFPNCKALQIDIRNNRDDISSFNTVARLDYIECDGNKIDSPDKTLLKATDQPGFNQVIWPKNHCTIDLLLIDKGNPNNLYLLSAKDSRPRKEIIGNQGVYNLYYSVVAEGFPLLSFVVNINHKGDFDNIRVSLRH